MFKERSAWSLPGIPTLLVLLAAAVGLGLLFFAYIGAVIIPAGDAVGGLEFLGLLLIVTLFVIVLVLFGGLTPVNPNEARALVLFGRYAGTVRAQGLHWVNPFTQRRRVSVRVRNFETAKLKVNDSDGNPIEIAAIVVWKVTDTAEAIFELLLRGPGWLLAVGIGAAGGGWVNLDDPDDQVVAMCDFPDGSTIDEWGLAYYSGDVVRGADLAQLLRADTAAFPPNFGSGAAGADIGTTAASASLEAKMKGS